MDKSECGEDKSAVRSGQSAVKKEFAMVVKDDVIEALAEQLECYRRLAKLAAAQHEHVQQSRVESLLEVLAARQVELARVQSLEETIAPAKKNWRPFLGELDDDQRRKAEGMMNETRVLLEQITTADRNDALVLQQRKLNLGKEINQATAARKVNRSYAAAAYGTPRSSMKVSG